VQHQAKWSGGSGKRQRYLRFWSQEFLNRLDHCLWRATCSTSRILNQAKDRPIISSVQQTLCFRIRTTEPHAVPRQVQQHLVTVQRHRRTRRTSAAAAAAMVFCQALFDVLLSLVSGILMLLCQLHKWYAAREAALCACLHTHYSVM